MKKILYSHIWLLIVCSLQSFADAAPQAKVLELLKFTNLNGNFSVQKKIFELDLELNSSGRFAVNRLPTGLAVLKWEIEKPDVVNICIDSLGLIMDQKFAQAKKKVLFRDLSKEANGRLMSLLRLLMMDQAALESAFIIENQNEQWMLVPKDVGLKDLIEKASIKINKNKLVESLLVFEKNKDQVNISFSNLKTSSRTSFVECQ